MCVKSYAVVLSTADDDDDGADDGDADADDDDNHTDEDFIQEGVPHIQGIHIYINTNFIFLVL